MNTVIYKALRLVLKLNNLLYGRGASREVLRDLSGEWREQVSYDVPNKSAKWLIIHNTKVLSARRSS